MRYTLKVRNLSNVFAESMFSAESAECIIKKKLNMHLLVHNLKVFVVTENICY